MTLALLPCPSCQRHVRANDALCPFCGDTLPASYAGTLRVKTPLARLGRAALFTLGASLAGAATTACDSDDPAPVNDSGVAAQDSGSDASVIVDAGADAVVPGDAGAGVDAGPDLDSGMMALYGGFPADAGDEDAAAQEEDGGSIGPLYGGFAAEDAG